MGAQTEEVRTPVKDVVAVAPDDLLIAFEQQYSIRIAKTS